MLNLYDVNGDLILLSGYSTPEDFGAVGDGVTDDTDAIQTALNRGGVILFNPSGVYLITTTLRVKKDTIIELNGSTINSTADKVFFNFLSTDVNFTGYNGNGNIIIRNGTILNGTISFAHGENIVLQNLCHKNTSRAHFLEICACKNYMITQCNFVGMTNNEVSTLEYVNIDYCTREAFPHIAEGSAFFDGTKNDGIIITDSYFSIGTGDYAYGFNAVGIHAQNSGTGYHKNIILRNNIIKGFTGCGVRLNNMQYVYIDNNDIEVAGDGIRVGDISACDNVVIKNNYVTAESGNKLVLTSSRYTNVSVVGNKTSGTIEPF